MRVFVYEVDNVTEPAANRAPMRFTEIYLGFVAEADFRKNPRSDLGTRTATLHAAGIAKLRTNWVYKTKAASSPLKSAKIAPVAGLKPRPAKARSIKG